MWRQDGASAWKRVYPKEYEGLLSRHLSGWLSLKLPRHSVVAILLRNGIEWDLLEKSAWMAGLCVFGVDPGLSIEQKGRLLEKSAARVLVTEATLIAGLEPKVAERLSALVVLDDETTSELDAWGAQTYRALFQSAPPLDFESSVVFPEPDSPAILTATSGTHGTPKIISYTHQQIFLTVRELSAYLALSDGKDRILCWLPQANLFQRVVNWCISANHSAIYFLKDPREMLGQLDAVRPTLLIGVPRFFQKVFASVHDRVPDWAPTFLRKLLLNLGGRSVRSRLGGAVRLLFTGSAPCGEEVHEFFRESVGLPLCEGYGVSENILPIALNRPGSCRSGSVGRPLPAHEVRVSEEGEVEVRGPGVMTGYVGEERRPIRPDGFLCTGDLGRFDEDGFLCLLGRKDNVFKTSTGRKISPEAIEARLKEVFPERDLVACGAGKPFPIVVVFGAPPAEESIRSLLSRLSAAQENVASFETVRALIWINSTLSVEAGELTPNLKFKRSVISKNYAPILDSVFDSAIAAPIGVLQGAEDGKSKWIRLS